QVFLLDEPLSNLDAKLRAGMRVELARLHQRLGTTMVYVTHDQIEAMTLGQRIVVMKDGQIQQIDTPMALYERPANLFVATFLGSPAMNVLSGTLRNEGGWTLALDDGTRLPLPADAGLDQAWHGRGLELGVRPEHLLRAGEGDADAFVACVDVVEPVGSEVYVNLRAGEQALVARLPPGDVPAPGSTLRLRVSAPHLHVFDADTGAALTQR
ncbi:MAG TPA: TOBE domain-containing protein, partial [Luteimonas sp.]|nr:TOBE domain-containing protein [Luteimonas sp.]